MVQFQYDGTDLIGEYDNLGNLQKRYVHGPGTDEPLVWYEGSGTGNRRWLHADERGSVIAATDNAGNVVPDSINVYDEYGIPGAGNTGRFQYTGQTWLPEIGMYYYKARMYSPTLGRFMQTDPIGYGDSMNLYGYVGGDPVNYKDPTGLVQTMTFGYFTYTYNCVTMGDGPTTCKYTFSGYSGAYLQTLNSRAGSSECLYASWICVVTGATSSGSSEIKPQKNTSNNDACAQAANELGKVRATGITGSVTGLFGVTFTRGTWTTLQTGTTGNFESSGFTVGLGAGATRTNVTYSSMGAFTGSSDGVSVSGTILPLGPVGFGGAYSWSWNDSGSGQGGGGSASPSFLPRFGVEGSWTYTNISNCHPKGE
jgi:RHS repeat-associated protein